MTYRNQPGRLVAVCAIALALTGCPANPEAGRPSPPTTTISPPTTATPTTASTATQPSTSPTASPPPAQPPTRPTAATGLTLAAGEAFIRHYVELLNFTYATGDTRALLAASDRGCVGCNGTADYLGKTNGKNGGLSGDYKDRLVAVKELFRGTSGRVGGSATIRSGSYIERISTDKPPIPRRAHTETWQFTLSAASGNWVMYEVEVEE